MPANRIARPRDPFEINIAPFQHPLLKNSAMASGCHSNELAYFQNLALPAAEK